jgi:V-type H+-transporting ATPase subunit A
LSEDQKCVMEIARLIREDFLKQNAFSDYDYYCPLYKTIGMMKSMVVFYDQALKAIAESGPESKLTWSVIETKLKQELYELTQLKFEMPKQESAKLERTFLDL